jgi:hypothetical protein
VSGGVWLEHDWFPRPLPENVELGERSWLDSSYVFHHFHSQRPCGVRIGEDSGVYLGTQFELGPNGEVEIGRFCTIVGAIFRTNGRVSIGDHTFVAHEVVMADAHAALPPDGSCGRRRRAVRRVPGGSDGRRQSSTRGGGLTGSLLSSF